MHEWYVMNQGYLDRAIQERAEAQARAAYLVVLGIETAANFIARALVGAARRLARSYRVSRRRRRTVQELSRLDDRMLRDIGIIGPGAIQGIAAELTEAAPPARTPALVPVAALSPRLRLDLDCPDLKHAA